MPIIKSAIKRLRQSEKRRIRNNVRKNRMKVLFKAFFKDIESGNVKEAETNLPKVYKAIDKAAKKGIIPKNTASRRKSRVARALASASK